MLWIMYDININIFDIYINTKINKIKFYYLCVWVGGGAHISRKHNHFLFLLYLTLSF